MCWERNPQRTLPIFLVWYLLSDLMFNAELVNINMMTSSDGSIFCVTGHVCGEFTWPMNSPHKGQWRGALLFSLIYVWILNKLLSKHSWGWWFETLSRPLWRHCNEDSSCPGIKMALGGRHTEIWDFDNPWFPDPILMITENSHRMNCNIIKM